jgi:quercetin dioxygenase-like cupin family protein
MRILLTAFTVILAMGGVAAQDAVTTLPDSYSTQFENEWVRVVRVYYAPHAKLPAHTHNALPAAYVYLSDGGPVLFKHIGTSYGAATRPATKAGGFRVFRGIDEVHEVENTSELPSEFLRVEFKTDPKDVRTLKGRFFRETAPSGQNVEKVQFENGQVRITRVIGAPGQSVSFTAGPSEPSLLIALQAATLRDARGSDARVRVGQEQWIPANTVTTFANVGSEASEFLRFDFKTAPVATSVQR